MLEMIHSLVESCNEGPRFAVLVAVISPYSCIAAAPYFLYRDINLRDMDSATHRDAQNAVDVVGLHLGVGTAGLKV